MPTIKLKARTLVALALLLLGVGRVHGQTPVSVTGFATGASIYVQGPPYNAKFNGTADDTAAIQAAINAAQASTLQVCIVFPSGHAVVSSTLQITKSSICIQGNGSYKLDDQTTNDTAILWTGGAAPVFQLGYNKQSTITSISRSSNVVTATFPAYPGGQTIANGYKVDIAGVTDSSYNGTFTLTSSTTTSATWAQTAADSSSSGGTITEDYQNADYGGLAPNFKISGVSIINQSSGQTALLNACTYSVVHTYTPGSSAIVDWRGGTIIGSDLTIANFDTPFYGVASDVDHFYDLYLTANHTGWWVGPRSDQMTITHGLFGCDDTDVTLESAHSYEEDHVSHVDSGSTSTNAFNITSNYSYGTDWTVLDHPWFEGLSITGNPQGWIGISGNATVGAVADHTKINYPVFNTNCGVYNYFLNWGVQAFDVSVTQPTRSGGGSISCTDGFINYSGTFTGDDFYIDPGIYNTMANPLITNTSSGVLSAQYPLIYQDTGTEMFSFGSTGSGLGQQVQYGCFDNNRGCVGYDSLNSTPFLGSTTASKGWELKYQTASPSGTGIVSMTGDDAGNVGIGPNGSNTGVASDPWNVSAAGAEVTASTQISPSKAFATLAACVGGTEGSLAAVSDSSTNTWGATITGGGTNHVLAYCDGTNWTVSAK
jgi:hypothetical protein